MICSNCEHLKIYIGNRLVADVDPYKENFGNLAHPPFVANIRAALGRGWGDLKIEGYIGGKVVITKRLSGKGVDQQFLVEPDDRELIGDGIDATRVVLKVTDEFGAVRPFANAAISLSLQGPGGNHRREPVRIVRWRGRSLDKDEDERGARTPDRNPRNARIENRRVFLPQKGTKSTKSLMRLRTKSKIHFVLLCLFVANSPLGGLLCCD